MAVTKTRLHHLLSRDVRGRVTIADSNVRVQRVVGMHLEGCSPEVIADGFDRVSLSAVYAALSYYYEHEQEMDEEDAQERVEAERLAREVGAEIL